MIPVDFFVVGAARAGTTSLYHYLAQHPEVRMCAVKEPNFFAFDGSVAALRGPGARWLAERSVVSRDAYLALFRDTGDAKAIGDVSPRYLQAPRCAEKIHGERPDARIVAILRQPVDRAFAGFVAHRRDGREPCATLTEAFDDEPRRKAAGWMGGGYSAGLYARQLKPYFERFDAGQIRIYLYEDFVADAAGLMADLFRFLDVAPDFEPDMSRRHNPSGEVRNPILRTFWRRSDALRRTIGPWIPRPLRDMAYQRVMRNTDKPQLSKAERAELTERYRSEIIDLQHLIGRDLSHWL